MIKKKFTNNFIFEKNPLMIFYFSFEQNYPDNVIF